MFVRNLAILLLFAPIAVASAFWPLIVMISAACLIFWRKRDRGRTEPPSLNLPLPVSLPHVLRFGLIFLGIQICSALAQRHTGRFGFLIVSFIGGFVSSASTTASAALLASRGQITPNTAGIAVVLTSISSALVNLPFIYQQTKQKGLTRTLTIMSLVVVLLGLAVMFLLQRFDH
jgi:uncharacterized membrane protein (DUF4010 family)